MDTLHALSILVWAYLVIALIVGSLFYLAARMCQHEQKNESPEAKEVRRSLNEAMHRSGLSLVGVSAFIGIMWIFIIIKAKSN